MKLRSSHLLLMVVVIVALTVGAVFGASAPVLQAKGDAFVAHQNGNDTWYIGSTNLELAVGLNASRFLVPQRLQTHSDQHAATC